MKLWLSEHGAYMYRAKGYKVTRIKDQTKASSFQWRLKTYSTIVYLWQVQKESI